MVSKNMEKKEIVVVLGMHRSGTSAITRSLKVLGVDLGGRLLPAEAGINDKGFWEDVDITAFNVDLLHALGHDWHTLTPVLPEEFLPVGVAPLRLRAVQLLRDKISSDAPFGIKDPRMARLLPFWSEIFAHLDLDVTYVIAFRNPMSVAYSLVKRNQFELEKGYLLWLEHMLNSLRLTRGCRRVFVSYERLLSQPDVELRRIGDVLGTSFDPQGAAFQEYRQDFLEKALQHNRYELADLVLDPKVMPQVLRLSGILDGLTRDAWGDDEELHTEIVGMHEAMVGQVPTYRLIGRYDAQCGAQRGEIDILNAGLKQRDTCIAGLEQQKAEHENALAGLSGRLQERDAWIAALERIRSEQDQSIAALTENLRMRDAAIVEFQRTADEELLHQKEQQEAVVETLQRQRLEQEAVVEALRQQLLEREAVVEALRQQQLGQEAVIADLQQTKAVNGEQVSVLVGRLADRDQQLAELKAVAARQGDDLASLIPALQDKAGQVTNLNATLSDVNARLARLEGGMARFYGIRFLARTLASRVVTRVTRPLVDGRLKSNGLFDARYYLSTYEDVRQAGVDPFKHFMEQDGVRAGILQRRSVWMLISAYMKMCASAA